MDKEQIQTKVFEWVQGAAEKVGEFAEKEVPPFIHEYLTWKFYEAVIEVALYVIGMTAFSIVLHYFWKWCISFNSKLKEGDRGFIFIPSCIASAIWAVFLFVNFPYLQIKNIVQLKIAPKVYLVEKASELIKK